VSAANYIEQGNLLLVHLIIKNKAYLVAINKAHSKASNTFTLKNKSFTLNDRLGVYALKNN